MSLIRAAALLLALAACGAPPPDDRTPSAGTDDNQATTDEPIDLAHPSRALASQAIFEATNAARTSEGLPPLQLCELCEVAAQQHADDMERLNFSSHDNPDPARRTPGMRLAAAGVSYSAWAENIGYHSVRRGSATYSYRALAESMVEWWMGSSGHRANILWTDVTHLGAACTLELDGSYPRMLCVENFVKLRAPR